MNKNLFLIAPILMMSFAVHASEYNIPLSPAAKTCIRNLIIQTYQEEWKKIPAKYFVDYTETIQLTCTEEDCWQAALQEQQQLQNPSPDKPYSKAVAVKETARLQRTFFNDDTVLSYSLVITPEQRSMIFRCEGMTTHRSMKTPK